MKIQSIILASMALFAVSCNSGTEKTDKAATNSDIQYVSTSEGEFPLDKLGFPEQETVKAIEKELLYQKAVQAYLWAIPQMVTTGQWEQAKKAGLSKNTDFFVQYNDPAVLGMLTPNTVVKYVWNFNNFEETGPMVAYMPGGELVGIVMDFQMRWVADIGLVSPNGPGPETFLILGPNDKKPAGADEEFDRVIRLTTNVQLFVVRVLDPVKDPDLENQVKLYPYSERENPKPNQFFQTAQDGPIHFLAPPSGMEYWEMVNRFVQQENVLEVDRYYMDYLKSLGIVKGEAFNPSNTQKEALEKAVFMGEKMAITASFHPDSKEAIYRDDTKWVKVITLNPDHRDGFVQQFTERIDLFWEAYGISPAMKTTTPGEGSTYLGVYKDAENNWFDGGKQYHYKIAADVPAAQFWDITAYNLENRSILINKGGNTNYNTFTEGLLTNDDGTTDIYFGPTEPEGEKVNWIQTNAGEYWFTYFRLYAPTETYFDSSWPMYDIVLVK